MYRFSKRSLDKLRLVHPILTAIVVSALRQHSDIDFAVIEGQRSKERQRELVDKVDDVTWTMDSKHLIQDDGYAHAVDLAPWVDGDIPWDDWSSFKRIARAMNAAAKDLGYGGLLEWGGDWKSIKDGPHFQLNL